MNNLDLVTQTLQELEVTTVRPLRWLIVVRTMPLETKTPGGLWLPPKLTSFYGELPHLRQIRGLVLAAGPKAHVKVGDMVCFQRLHFARWTQLKDQTYVGFVDYNQLHWIENDHGQESASEFAGKAVSESA